MGVLERWDARNQRIAERDNERLGGDDWVEKVNREMPGPAWAWALYPFPVVGWVALVVLAVAAWRKRQRERPE